MVLTIVQSGDPVLRRPAQPLTRDEILGADVQQLIASMRDTMRNAPGVGLAAPQIGRSIQLVVIEDPPHLSARMSSERRAATERGDVAFHVLINPHVSIVASEPATFFEGCLSLHGLVMVVPRARRVRVDALDARGEPVQIEARGWYARILQHECDHLLGTLCVDRMLPRTLMTAESRERYWGATSERDVCAALGAPWPDERGSAARS